jgi:hypothetical protein
MNQMARIGEAKDTRDQVAGNLEDIAQRIRSGERMPHYTHLFVFYHDGAIDNIWLNTPGVEVFRAAGVFLKAAQDVLQSVQQSPATPV